MIWKRLKKRVYGDDTSIKEADAHFDVPYRVNGRHYVVRVPSHHRPSKILRVSHKGQDVTDHIAPYLGHRRKFHGIPTTPQLLGYSCLDVTYLGRQVMHYDSDDVIVTM